MPISFFPQSMARRRAFTVITWLFLFTAALTMALTVQADEKGTFASTGTTVTTPATNCTSLIKNGDFEATGGWSVYSAGGMSLLSSFPPPSGAYHSGQRGAYLGDYNNALDYIAQEVSIPANANKADLHLWWQIETEEDNQQVYDTLSATLEDASGQPLTTLHQWSNEDAASLWQESQFDLLPYKGQTVTLRLTARTDANLPTAFYLDDVRLDVCSPWQVWLPRVTGK